MADALLHWVPSMVRARMPHALTWAVGKALTLAVGVAACTPSPPAVPDAAPTEPEGDARSDDVVDPDTRGVTVLFMADPALPLSFDSGDLEVSIDSLQLRLENLRVIGDAAPGDERTRIDRLALRWPADDSGSEGGDVEIEYADAPPGIYSLFRASIVYFEIDGEVEGRVDGEELEYEFEIERGSGAPLAIEIDLGSAALEPGGIIELNARLDVREMVASVPWAELRPDDEGDVEIDSDDEVMGDIESGLDDAFGTSTE